MRTHLMEYLETTCSKHEDKVAIVDGDRKITFQELKNRSLAIRNKLNLFSIDNCAPIAIYLPKSCDSIICYAGVLYSGNFYIPFDVKSPKERTKKILELLKPEVVITNKALKNNIVSLGFSPDKILEIDTIDVTSVGSEELHWTPDMHIDLDPAYTLFTSGSTGEPKGVVISHRSVIDYIDWLISKFCIDDTYTIGNQAPFFFDNSVFDIYLMMATGATLVLIPEQLFMFPAKLLDYLNEKKINMVFWVPSVLVSIANYQLLDKIEMPCLNKIIFAGEVMPSKQLNYWRRNVPNAMYINLYGPTEITVDCTYFIVDREIPDDEPVPIGYPCRNSDILILNDEDKLCKMNQNGELCVRGSSLALGYFNQPEKTIEVFVQNPLNINYPEKIYRTGDIVYNNKQGEIIFVGRKDYQIKHMGYRIELGDIESSVRSLVDIDDACVVYDHESKDIKLFYTAQQIDLSVDYLRIQLTHKLPKYMIPTSFTQLEQMPLTPSGKINRSLLQDMI